MDFVVIVAGGTGSRMQSDIPKQFMTLNGLPVLMHTMNAFRQAEMEAGIILVLAKELVNTWHRLCEIHAFNMEHALVDGGATRFHSVKNALAFIRKNYPQQPESFVAIHDAARPLVDSALIKRSFQEAAGHGSSVAAIQSRDSVRFTAQNGHSKTVDRQKVFLIQTPQTFRLADLLNAYEQAYDEQFTDDASVIEKAGYPIHLTAGDTRNIKITFAEDIGLASFLLNQS